MKKILALGMAMALTVSSLAGCGGSKPAETAKAEETKAADTAKSEDTKAAEDTKAEESAKEGGKIVFIATQLGDMSFNDNGWAGVQEIGDKYGYEVSVIETGMDSSKYENMFLDICDSDADYIIAQSGNGWGDIVFKYAPE